MNPTPALRKAGGKELELFYSWMERQFHPGELKSLQHIGILCARGVYSAYGLWAGEELIAYALLGNTVDKSRHLLDYYAVLPRHQDKGWGGRFLEMLKKTLGSEAILLEVEDPDYAPDAAEKAHWIRRVRFYERNGCLHTGVSLNLFGFDYTLMQLPQTRALTDAEVRAAMEEIYRLFIPQELYIKHVNFREMGGE